MPQSNIEAGTKFSAGNRRDGRADLPRWLILMIVAGALLMAMGAVIAVLCPAMLVSPQAEVTDAVRVYAHYFAARNLVLPVVLLVALALRARRMLGNVLLLVGFVQVLDLVLDCVDGRWSIVPAVLFLAALYLLGACRVTGNPFWRRAAWE